MSYNHMNYTPVSGNYPLPYTVPSSLQNQQGTTPAKRHKCQFCVFTSDKPYNVKRHIERKHGGMNIKNVQGCGVANMHKHVVENINPQMEIGQAQVVYQQNFQQHDQTPDHTQAQAVFHQPVNVGGNYQHPMQPQIKCSMSQGQIHGESNGAFQHGSSLQSHIPVNADVETQTGVEMDRDKDRYKRTSNILEILRGISFAFDHLKDFRKQYRDVLPEFKKLEKADKEKFIKTYAYFKV